MDRGPGRAGGPGGGRRSEAAASRAQERSHVGCGGTGGGGDGGGEGGGGGGDGCRGAPRGRAPAGHAPPPPPRAARRSLPALRENSPRYLGPRAAPCRPGPSSEGKAARAALARPPTAQAQLGPVGAPWPTHRSPAAATRAAVARAPLTRPYVLSPPRRAPLTAPGRPSPRGWARRAVPASRAGRRARLLSHPSRPRAPREAARTPNPLQPGTRPALKILESPSNKSLPPSQGFLVRETPK